MTTTKIGELRTYHKTLNADLNVSYETNINSIVFPMNIGLTLKFAVYLYSPYI
jgi:hypothetical protein